MKHFFLLSCCLSFTLTACASNPPVDAGLSEVVDLGRINGQGLACGYSDVAARIKAIMIASSPKSRRYGAAFEEATNEAFLAQSRKASSTCLDGPTFAAQVEAINQRLQAAFPPVASVRGEAP